MGLVSASPITANAVVESSSDHGSSREIPETPDSRGHLSVEKSMRLKKAVAVILQRVPSMRLINHAVASGVLPLNTSPMSVRKDADEGRYRDA